MFGGCLVSLGRVEGEAGMCDNMFPVVTYLSEYCTYGMEGNVCVETKGKGIVWEGDNGSRGEAVPEGGEGSLALIVQVEGRVFLCELVEGARQLGEVLDEPPVVEG